MLSITKCQAKLSVFLAVVLHKIEVLSLSISTITGRIDAILKERGISKQEFYAACGISSAAYSQWNTGKTVPRAKRLQIIADYLHVNTEYLATGHGEKETAPTLSKKDERDIEKRLESVLEELEGGQGGLAFSGEPLDDETRELLIKSLRNSMEVGKALAKKKYTPKKYRKE